MHSTTRSLILTGIFLAHGTCSLQPLAHSTVPPATDLSAASSRSWTPIGRRLRHGLIRPRIPRGGATRVKAIAIPNSERETLPPLVEPHFLIPITRTLSFSRALLPELAAEAFGTFLLLQLALGVVMISTFLPQIFHGIVPIACLTGMAIYAASNAVSDRCAAHFNPAITWAMCLYRNFGWRKFVPYSIAQMVGATGAALVNFVAFAPQIAKFEAARGIARGSSHGLQTAKTFACYSAAPPATAFLAETMATFVLSAVVFRLTRNQDNDNAFSVPAMVGATVALIITIVGPISGASLNPVRELGPRMVLKLCGWSSQVAFHQVGLYVASALLGATAGGFWVDRLLYPKQESEQESYERYMRDRYSSYKV